MKDYISVLQSQIARNSVEIQKWEFSVSNAKSILKTTKNYYTSEYQRHSEDCFAGKYLTNILFQLQCDKNYYLYAKKTLKKLVENQKMLKKLKTQLVVLDSLYGEEVGE